MKDNVMAVIGIIILLAMFFVAGIIDRPEDYHYGADKRQVVRMSVPQAPAPAAPQPLFYGVVDGKMEFHPNRWAVVEPFCKGLDEVHCRVYFVDDDRLDFDLQVVIQPIGNYNEAELVEILGGKGV